MGIMLFVIGLVSVEASAMEGNSLPAVFTSAEATNSTVIPELSPALELRSRLVTLDLSLFDLDRSEKTHPTLNFNIFPGLNVPVSYLQGETHGTSNVWIGKIQGQPDSSVVLAVTDGVAMGNLRTDEGHLVEIAYAGGDRYVVRQVDTTAYPQEMQPLPVDPASLPQRRDKDGAMADDGSTIDVMVVYTQSAVSAVGGLAAMQSRVATALAESNMGYANSGITQRLNIVHQAQVEYDESVGFSQTLNDVTNNGDGKLDVVHEWRDTYKADMVSMWINNTDYCGLAWLMTSTASDFSSRGFSVVHYGCATGYYSFAHEMGHNQGAHHDRANASGPGVFSYSYGYQSPTSAFRTVMAYNCPSGCSRVNYWSNPNVTYSNGEVMGVSETATDSAYNTLSMNNTNVIVANWRDSGGSTVTVPSVTTGAVSAITTTTATVGGAVTEDGGAGVTGRGICYGTSPSPRSTCVADVSGGTGAFSVALSGLSVGTPYYAAAYATNSAGTAYGSDVSFTTESGSTPTVPSVATYEASDVTSDGATLNGTVTDDGGADVTERGFCYGTTSAPRGTCVADSSAGTGTYFVAVSGLSAGTPYYAAAYATNSAGTAYGDDVSFTTESGSTPTVPSVATYEASDVTSDGATLNGTVTDDGGADVTERGFCYGTTSAPRSTCVADSSVGTGTYFVAVSGLSAGTPYYAAAYATNSAGTAYGDDVSFTTVSSGLPTVTTATPTVVMSNFMQCGGAVTNEGSSTVTARGVCYNTSGSPTLGATCVASGDGTGSFVATLKDLAPATTYHLRAYATNGSGTAYGNDVATATLAGPTADENWGLLWRNTANGMTLIQYFEKNNPTSSHQSLLVSNQAWQPLGWADFNKNDSPDAYWRNLNTGDALLDLLIGWEHSTFIGQLHLPVFWQPVAFGDFNGDKYSDILWRNANTGAMYVQIHDGTEHVGFQYVLTLGNLAWSPVGAGDFDADGTDDLLFRNSSNGKNAVITMDNAAVKGVHLIKEISELTFRAVGAADVDDDGHTDILWYYPALGNLYVEYMNGFTHLAYALLEQVNPVWRPVSASDMNTAPPLVGDTDYAGNGDGKQE